MRKSIPIILALAALVLSACLPQTPANPANSPTADQANAVTSPIAPPATLAVSPTAPQPDPTKPVSTAVLPVSTQAAVFPDSGCTVVTTKPTPGPTPESIYPAVTDKDWAKGPSDARVTIIEYSDFQ
jgi:hypothetical protein